MKPVRSRRPRHQERPPGPEPPKALRV